MTSILSFDRRGHCHRDRTRWVYQGRGRASLVRAIGALVFGTVALGVFGAPAEIWVSPDGHDSDPGTRDRPVATLQHAQRKARELRRRQDPSMGEGIHILLRQGTYSLTAPLRFRWEDSGTNTSPTVVESAPGEHAVLSGGIAVTGWTKAERVAGLPEIARGRVWMAEAPRVAGRPLEFRELWVRDAKTVRARTPNDPVMSQLAGWDRKAERAAVPASALGGVVKPEGVEMILEQQWEIAVLRLRTIDIVAGNAAITFQAPESAVEFQHPWPQPILPPKGGGAFYLVNAIEFLDSPGEWFQDPATKRVYYWPRDGENLMHDEVVAPVAETILDVGGTLDRPVQHVSFRHLSFAHTAWSRPGASGHVPLQAGMAMTDAYSISPPGTPDKKGLENQAWITRITAAVHVAAANQVTFERCRFEHTGASALDLHRGVHDAAVMGCVFRDVGDNGIQLGSFQEDGVETHVPYHPADDREVCARIRIANNILRDTANADWGGVAVISGYAREIAIEHNDIADTSYTGISVGWGWTRTANACRDNSVHANLIRRAATRMCDTAGIYTQSAQPGTVVSENVVDEIKMNLYVDIFEHWFYLYTDEGTSQVTVRDNWCPQEKFLQNANGPGNVWTNNGPKVSDEIRRRAGLQPEFRDLLPTVAGR